jgi:hypothetical protein
MTRESKNVSLKKRNWFQTALENIETKINLPDGKSWYTRLHVLPDDVKVSRKIFDDLWALHPKELLKVKMPSTGDDLVEAQRYSQLFGKSYTYSGVVHEAFPLETHPFLNKIIEFVQKHSGGKPYKSVLINWYDGGEQYIGPHHDSTEQLVENSDIYSFTFGAERDFVIAAECKKKTKNGAFSFYSDEVTRICSTSMIQQIVRIK